MITYSTIRSWYKQHRTLTPEEKEQFKEYLKVKAKFAPSIYQIIQMSARLEYTKYCLKRMKEDFELYWNELIPYRKILLKGEKIPDEWYSVEQRLQWMVDNKIFNLGKKVWNVWFRHNHNGGLMPYGQIGPALAQVINNESKHNK